MDIDGSLLVGIKGNITEKNVSTTLSHAACQVRQMLLLLLCFTSVNYLFRLEKLPQGLLLLCRLLKSR